MTSRQFFWMAAATWQFYFRFRFWWRRSIGKVEKYSKSTCRPNVDEISQSTAEILLLPVSENKLLLCWKSTSGFDFHVCFIIGMSFCICLTNFV